jgi:hypothetical protein
MKVAEGAFYLEAIPANGFAMRAARNERDVIASRGHAPTEITSNGTRCHDRGPHLDSPQVRYLLRRKASTLEGSRPAVEARIARDGIVLVDAPQAATGSLSGHAGLSFPPASRPIGRK